MTDAYRMPSLPFTLALKAVEVLINQALRYDPATQQRLSLLAGKSVFLETEAPHLALTLSILPEQIKLRAEPEPNPSVSIRAPSIALARMALAKQPQLIGGELKVQGQVQLLEQLQAIAKQLDVDWEEPIAMLFGDIAAQQVGQQLRGFFNLARKTAQTFLLNGSEYLQHEQELLPMRWEIDEFIEQSQDLRIDLERLEARQARLTQRLQQLQQRNSSSGTSL